MSAIAAGAIASAWAAAQFTAWIALGSLVVRGRSAPPISSLCALLAGSGVTGFLLAVLSATAGTRWALAATFAASGLGLLFGGRRAWEEMRGLARIYAQLTSGRRVVRGAGLILLAWAWMLACCPPRDADVMRYHLGHIRQIDIEGRWTAIPDLHFSFPFGWSLNYLPFEHWGLPQGAHFLNLGLWVVAALTLAWAAKKLGGAGSSFLLTGLFVFQPYVLKMATTAFAEMYLLLVALTVVVLLTLPQEAGAKAYGLLGFAAWIGMQSRYQAAAIGLAVTLLVLIRSYRDHVPQRAYVQFAAGGAAAWVLSSPFYVMNALSFRNPVWPLMTRWFGNSGYADETVRRQLELWNGTLTLQTVAEGLRWLVREPTVFPFPLLGLLLLAMALWKRAGARGSAAGLLALLWALWVVAQPTMFPKSALMLTPVILIGWAGPLGKLLARPGLGRWLSKTAVLGMAALAGVGVMYSADSFHLIATGDFQRFHRATWFYEVYEWANRHTLPQARFLVVVYSAQTYYLERWHRRADPPSRGVVDWREVRGDKDLALRMDEVGCRYLIYQDVDWSGWPGGEPMMAAVKAARVSPLFEARKEFEVELVTLRTLRQGYKSKVVVLERLQPALR